MSGQTVHINKNEGLLRIEARFAYNADFFPRLKQTVGARWDPSAKCWWVEIWLHKEIVDLFTESGYEVLGDLPGKPKDPPKPPPPKEPPPPKNMPLVAAVNTLFKAVSPERHHRLARAIAVAAHPDGDGPNRPAAADDLVLIATTRLNGS